ncbi:hypothetical protein KDK_46290 [Dictyobacter kobayashii]|uniref:Uncharacterized protein n=1 Tax=Dictyobacter kobayashii TaxID=2014872 RepID=A0A402AP75_9CHLR|nr:hypothetical protein KDK_46290 [Dictyobacter kobayashii]
MNSAVYVWGKYLAALLILLGLACLQVLSSIIADAIITWPTCPPLGAVSYLETWGWLSLLSLGFTAALPLFLTTVTRGQRAVSSVVVLLIWLIPLFLQTIPGFLVVWGASDTVQDPAARLVPPQNKLTPELARQLVQQIQSSLIPAHLTPVFLLNRAFFLGLAVLLILATGYSFQRQRRSH